MQRVAGALDSQAKVRADAGAKAPQEKQTNKRKSTGGSSSIGSSKKPAPPLAQPPLPPGPLPVEPGPELEPLDPFEEEEETEAAEEKEAEGDPAGGAAELDEDDPAFKVLQLESCGITDGRACELLAKTNGDVDAAIMLIFRQRDMEQENLNLAAAMEESLKENEQGAAKRDAEDADKKRSAPAQYFASSSFLANLNEVAGVLLEEGCAAREDLIAMLDLEKRCKVWYHTCRREVDEKFAAIAAELVARRAESNSSGGGSRNVVEPVHTMLKVHLETLKTAVFEMPQGTGGGVPGLFSPSVDAATEHIDLTQDVT